MKVSLNLNVKNIFSKTECALFTANICALLIGFANSLLLPKWLGGQQYGGYTFIFTLLEFLSGILEFGIITSAARLLLMLNTDKDRNMLMILMGKILGIGSVIICVIVVIASFLIDDVYKDSIGKYLLLISFFSGAAFLPFFTSNLFKAYGCIYKLAKYNFFSKFLCFMCIACMFFIDVLTLENCLLFSLLSSFIVFIIVYKNWLFTKTSISMKMMAKLLYVNIQYGIKNYLSRFIGTQTTLLIRLGIGYFVGLTDIGLYGICNALFAPALIAPQSLASARYTEFSDYKRIENKYMVYHFLLSICGNVMAFVFAMMIFLLHYSTIYGIIPRELLFILLVTYICMALYYPYNEWLTANGMGNEQLITGVIHGVIEIILAIILVPMYGICGAAAAMLISRLYFLLHTIFFYYKRII